MVDVAAETTAASWAEAQVVAARDHPQERRRLAERTYDGPFGRATVHVSFRRAELAFMDWQLARGVLEPPVGPNPGSPWWRACNERLLRDGCEAVARSGGRGGAPSSPTIAKWMDFVAKPRATTWYRAHNASIVAAYLDHQELAVEETEAERFFCNVTLLRVLFAHAMVAAPELALGWLRAISPALGDPRVRMTGLFLSLSRVLPDRYPLEDDLLRYLDAESRFAHLLDFGVIGPRLQRIYEWSAAVLEEPEVCSLISNGSPRYACEVPDELWQPTRPRGSVRALRRLLPA